MLNYALLISACLVSDPSRCVADRIPFEAVNGLPTECAAFAASVLPDWARRRGVVYRIRYRCVPSVMVEADL
jgi:hypothetical protein